MKHRDRTPNPETVRELLAGLIGRPETLEFTCDGDKYVVNGGTFDADLINSTIEYMEHQKNPRADRRANRPFAQDPRFQVREYSCIDADFLNKYYQQKFYDAIGDCTSVYELIDCLEGLIGDSDVGEYWERVITSCALHIANTRFPVSDPEFHARMQKRNNITLGGHFFVPDPA